MELSLLELLLVRIVGLALHGLDSSWKSESLLRITWLGNYSRLIREVGLRRIASWRVCLESRLRECLLVGVVCVGLHRSWLLISARRSKSSWGVNLVLVVEGAFTRARVVGVEGMVRVGPVEAIEVLLLLSEADAHANAHTAADYSEKHDDARH